MLISYIIVLTGNPILCEHASTQLTATPAGGRWVSLNETIATVSSSGVVTGITSGTAEIRYTVQNIQGVENSAYMIMTVNPLPVPGFEVNNTWYGENTIFTSLSTGGMVSYHWNLGDGTTANSSDVIHQYKAPGTYQVELEVTNQAGCTNSITKSVEIKEEISTGIEEIPVPNIRLLVYPNPVSRGQYVKVETGLDPGSYRKAWLYISDFNGKLIHRQEITSESMTVQMPSAPGIYLMLVYSDEPVKTVKIIVK